MLKQPYMPLKRRHVEQTTQQYIAHNKYTRNITPRRGTRDWKQTKVRTALVFMVNPAKNIHRYKHTRHS